MLSAYVPTAQFHDAAAHLSSAPSLSKVSNATKLELYGLFKYLTVSHTPNTSRPGLLDFTGRAKWDAWNTTGKQFADRAREAEARYLQIATELGWKPGEAPAPLAETKTKQESADTSEDGDIWDKETDGKSKGPSGFGNTVSIISQGDEERREQGTLHALAVSGDAEGLQAFLQSHSDTQLDEKDEYGYTALHLASDRGHIAVVKLLLERGANPSLKDADDLTAVELARVSEHDDIARLLESIQ